ncbi:MAG: hypothetical protein COZ85_01285 [Candidatus Moranbacteria bacterium CG_4_8_14_3_um_filter_34_16]|nr:MAG: hypothetical protein COT31_03160 [Candidatus Moranbacteria bacterium CG08_land_8_20_14_0_20_34_16]PIW95175.1 MAG: hypothetical protein COZ85_01285 [Candidatus Moranbacteria bacterium CG_4_8_14_3_um_filter_34_16]PJA89512.1 MAG: hypothetical protein CO138_00060 [Candidatus Moranbacteria bacterium CG_4_9_14_3_um_filter_33_15]
MIIDNQPVKINRDKNPRSDWRGMSSQTAVKSFARPEANNREGENEKFKNNKLMTKMLDRLIGFSMFMIFFGIPLYFTGFSFQGVGFEKQIYFYAWLLLGIVVWVIKGIVLGEMRLQRTFLDIPILGLWLSFGLSTIFSVDKWRSFFGAFFDPSTGFIGTTALVIAYYFIMSNFNEKRLKMILIALISSGLILIAWTIMAILQIHIFPDSVALYLPVSLLGDFSSLGVMFAFLAIIFTLAILKLAEAELDKIRKNIFLSVMFIFLVLDLYLVMAFYSQVPWLGLFAGIGIFLIYILARIVRPKASWVWFPMVVFIVIMILRMIGPVQISKISLLGGANLDYKNSLEIAKESLKENFIIGSGPATYGYDFSLKKPQSLNESALSEIRFYRSGLLFESISTLGALGAFFLIILALSFLGTQMCFAYIEKEKNKMYSLGFFSASSVLFFSVLFSRVSGPVLVLSVLIATVSLAVSLWESDAEKKQINLTLKSSPKYALAMAFVFMVVITGVAFLFAFLGKIYIADVYAGKGAREISKNTDQAFLYLQRAINLNRQESKYYIQASQYYMAIANDEASKDENSRDTVKIQEYLNNSIILGKKSVEMSKNDVETLESLALIYENAGLYVSDSLALAQEQYKEAQKLEPQNPAYYLKLGLLEISQAIRKEKPEEKKQLLEEANKLFQKAIEKNKNYPDAYYQTALVNEALENFDQAIEAGEKAIRINPRNSNYLLFLGRVYQKRGKEGDQDIAQRYYQGVVAINDKDVVGHFYLGLFWEKTKKMDEAKKEYQKVLSLFEEADKNGQGNKETEEKIREMISNVEKGVENTPENLGLIEKATQPEKAETLVNDSVIPTSTPEGSGSPSFIPSENVTPAPAPAPALAPEENPENQ